MGQPGLSGEPGVRGPMGPKGEKVSQAGGNFLHEQKEIRPSANEARNCGVKLWVLQDAGITGWRRRLSSSPRQGEDLGVSATILLSQAEGAAEEQSFQKGTRTPFLMPPPGLAASPGSPAHVPISDQGDGCTACPRLQGAMTDMAGLPGKPGPKGEPGLEGVGRPGKPVSSQVPALWSFPAWA